MKIVEYRNEKKKEETKNPTNNENNTKTHNKKMLNETRHHPVPLFLQLMSWKFWGIQHLPNILHVVRTILFVQFWEKKSALGREKKTYMSNHHLFSWTLIIGGGRIHSTFFFRSPWSIRRTPSTMLRKKVNLGFNVNLAVPMKNQKKLILLPSHHGKHFVAEIIFKNLKVQYNSKKIYIYASIFVGQASSK